VLETFSAELSGVKDAPNTSSRAGATLFSFFWFAKTERVWPPEVVWRMTQQCWRSDDALGRRRGSSYLICSSGSAWSIRTVMPNVLPAQRSASLPFAKLRGGLSD